MIKKVEVLISFPKGAYFTGDINLQIYQQFINFVKGITCVCINTKCNECQNQANCRYYHLTGENFSHFPGILVQNEIFDKRRYQTNEQKKIVFYLVGSAKSYYGYIDVFFENLQQNLFGNLFYLKNIQISEMKKKDVQIDSLKVTTPIPQEEFNEQFNSMIQYYNQHYGTKFNELNEKVCMSHDQTLALLPFCVKTKRMRPKGYVGNISFQSTVTLDNRLLEIGIGQFNFIGGGHCETKNNI